MAKRDTKQHIINAAIDCYSKYGYKTTTCEDLAGMVGIRPSALYKHYKGKREVYAASVQQLADGALAAAQDQKSPARHFKQQPALLFVALHAAMAGGEDMALVNQLALEPISAYWGIEKLYALAGGIVWENAA